MRKENHGCPDQVAAVCPRDGETRCSGAVGARDLTGWIWATADQVKAVMGLYAPAILTADPPSVGGPEYLLADVRDLPARRVGARGRAPSARS